MEDVSFDNLKDQDFKNHRLEQFFQFYQSFLVEKRILDSNTYNSIKFKELKDELTKLKKKMKN